MQLLSRFALNFMGFMGSTEERLTVKNLDYVESLRQFEWLPF
jgi:hypothetical protein